MNFSRGSQWRQWDLHVHTASSYDAKYKGQDSDELLCKSLTNNKISAVAITDHFLIDANRIKNLKQLAPNITFFPGVELRTDKGATNIHVILIFSENSDLKALSEDMNVFRRQAENSTDDNRVIWDYKDILDFAKSHNAITSIHAGSKSSGIDDEIAVTDSVSDAIKNKYADSVHIFEIGKIRDVKTFNSRVFPSLGQNKPLILCSDNHDPRHYSRKEKLWIKADLTFEGLQQVILQPVERVFIGSIPPSLERVNSNKQNYISSISVNRVSNPKNTSETWFNFNLPLNSELVTIIGNKGSGKSALADILGLFSNCKTMDSASFLNPNRFRKSNKNYASDYEGNLTWYDGQIDKTINLQSSSNYDMLENAQYLPQRYIEDVCNDLGSGFKEEINRVIFSYVNITDRGNTSNLHELIKQKSQAIEELINNKLKELNEINNSIINLEDKMTTKYINAQKEGQKKCEEKLKRHLKSKPIEVKKNSENNNSTYLNKLKVLNSNIETINNSIHECNQKLTIINISIDSLNTTLTRIKNSKNEIDKLNRELALTSQQYNIDNLKITTNFEAIIEKIQTRVYKFYNEKANLLQKLDSNENANPNTSLIKKLSIENHKKHQLISTSDAKEKEYQKYVDDLRQWDEQMKNIIGTPATPESLEFYKNQVNYVENRLKSEYTEKCNLRLNIIYDIFNLKKQIAQIYSSIYLPVQEQLQNLIGDMEDKIDFASELSISNLDIGDDLLKQINKTYSGIFNGSLAASSKMNSLIKSTDFNDWESTKLFILNVMKVITDDFDTASKKVHNRENFYSMLCSLKYIDAQYNLKMGGRNLNELSPGEKGILLLIFYLALSKDKRPLIIDQPEDNLDNQSVYSKLVKCITEAKKKRQVIIVTHNPNIAVACDSEQIIYCTIDKSTNSISYVSGSIENETIRNHVIDVLEGTMPAFDLRRRKYSVSH